MRGKEKEGLPYFTLWWVWKELLRTDLHINLSSVFPFFFFFIKPSWPGPPPCAHWLPPRDTTQLPVPTDSPAPRPPAIAQSSAMDTHHQGLFFHSWLQSIFCFISVSLFQGELLRLFLNLYSAPCFFFFPLNQDSWAKNRKSGSSSALLREALVFSGGCASEGSRCINYPAHAWMPPLQSFLSPCVWSTT